MAYLPKRPSLLFIATSTLIAMAVTACDSSPDPLAPQPLQTPRPIPGSITVDQGVQWLEDAGLTVEVIDDITPAGPRYGSMDIRHVSVNGYASVWLMVYEEPPDYQDQFRNFSLNADFPTDGYPVLIQVSTLVYLVRGLEADTSAEVLTAVWDMVPPGGVQEIIGLPNGYRHFLTDASAFELEQLNERSPGAIFSGPVTVPVLTTMDNFADTFKFDPLLPNLPHPDTSVWVNQYGDAAGSEFVTIVSEIATGIPVGEIRTERQLDLSEIEDLPSPSITGLVAMDGDENTHDEVSVIVEVQIPPPGVEIFESWTESVDSLVIERAQVGTDQWKPIAWIRDDGWDLSDGQPVRFVSPAGRVNLSPDTRKLAYWDFDVQSGERYSYLAYGCTNFGRQTAYSQTSSGVAGDPFPVTADFGGHLPSTVTLQNCAIERD